MVLLAIPSALFLITDKRDQIPLKVDLITVFPGNPNRISEGLILAGAGKGSNLVVTSITPTSERIIPFLKDTGISVEAFTALPAGLSRDTFEDALVTYQIILRHKFKSVVLVTSDYHMARAYSLLSLLLRNTDVKIFRWSVTDSQETKATKIPSEIVKFWGSVCELILFKVTGVLPQDFV